MKKEYSNGELTIVWKPGMCIHAGNCVKALPGVYKPKEKPWIQIENANTEALIRQINNCPSGALSYYLNEDKIKDKMLQDPVKVKVLENGPLMINGNITITGVDGKEKIREKSTAFCRCGQSGNKPYCDGKHKQTDFRG